MILLLTTCVILLAVYAALAWFYLSALRGDAAVLTSIQAETGRAFLGIKEQQAASAAPRIFLRPRGIQREVGCNER